MLIYSSFECQVIETSKQNVAGFEHSFSDVRKYFMQNNANAH